MKLRSLECLRGLAALSVVFAHGSTLIVAHQGLGFSSFHHGLEFYGAPGLEFFFVLSGFVMAMMHGGDMGRASRVPPFLWSRFCRIYPLLWALLAVRMWQVWPLLTVTPGNVLNWVTLNPFNESDLNPVFWTLKLELGFYTLFAASLLPWVGPFVLACWAGYEALFVSGFPLGAYLPAGVMAQPFLFKLTFFSLNFFAGLIAGDLFRRVRLPAAAAAALAAAGLALAAWRLSQDGWGQSYGPPVARLAYGAGYGSLMLGLASLERAGHIRLGRWAAVMGIVSYPLYIVHVPVIDAVSKVLETVGRPPAMGQNTVFILYVTGSVAASLVLAYAVDRPLRRLLRQGVRRPSAAHPAAAA